MITSRRLRGRWQQAALDKLNWGGSWQLKGRDQRWTAEGDDVRDLSFVAKRQHLDSIACVQPLCLIVTV